jgi:hypothetical protein
MASIGRCLAALLLVTALGACKKSDGTSTAASDTAAGGGGDTAGQGGAGEGTPAGSGDEGGDAKNGAGGGGGGGAMSVAEFCKTYGEKAQKEGGKAADFWNRNLGKDCEKDLGDEKKKKGDEKWNEFVNCAAAQPTAAEAFDACEL